MKRFEQIFDRIYGTLAGKRVPRRHANYIRKKFDEATVRLEPYPHLVIDEVLPPKTYDSIERRIPTTNDWQSAEKAMGGAPFIEFGNRQCEPLHLYHHSWQRYYGYVEFINRLIVQKMNAAIKFQLAALARNGLAVPNAQLKTGQTLFCHRPTGWDIEPHVHNMPQLVQTMIYFPLAGSCDEMGTIVFEQRCDRDIVKRDLNRTIPSDASEISQYEIVSYRKNRLFTFLNTPVAVHGAKAIPNAPPRQYLFMAIILKKGDALEPDDGYVNTADFRMRPYANLGSATIAATGSRRESIRRHSERKLIVS